MIMSWHKPLQKDTDSDIDLAQMNKRIQHQAGAYIE